MDQSGACDRRLAPQNMSGSGTSRAQRDLLPYHYVAQRKYNTLASQVRRPWPELAAEPLLLLPVARASTSMCSNQCNTERSTQITASRKVGRSSFEERVAHLSQ